MTAITQPMFERCVPAFRDADVRIFEAVQPVILKWQDVSHNDLGIVPDDETTEQMLTQYVCAAAAYDAVPQMDLALTENGFAVVSNQNYAPASRDRVQALREELRAMKSDAYDRLRLHLLTLSPDSTPRACAPLRATLLGCPMLLRRYGVTMNEGRTVYEKEYRALLPRIYEAQHAAARITGEEMMEWLVAHQDEYAAVHPENARNVLREKVCRFMAAHIMQHKGAAALARQIQAFLNERAADLPEYANSQKYMADMFKPYENEKNDSCYFFG